MCGYKLQFVQILYKTQHRVYWSGGSAVGLAGCCWVRAGPEYTTAGSYQSFLRAISLSVYMYRGNIYLSTFSEPKYLSINARRPPFHVQPVQSSHTPSPSPVFTQYFPYRCILLVDSSLVQSD